MRFLIAFVLMFALAIPAWAQGGGTQYNFGRVVCPQPVSCPDDYKNPVSASDLASRASACITQSFGYVNQNGFFDDSAGLDSNDCLTTIPNVLPKGMGSRLVPSCCVIKKEAGGCAFQCELNTAP